MMRIVCAVPAIWLAVGLVVPVWAAEKAPKKVPRYAQMDYGPFLKLSIMSSPTAKFENSTGHMKGSDVTPRGIAINLSPEGAEKWIAGVVFDADTLRMSAGWMGAPLRWEGVIFNGSHGPSTTFGNEPVFQTPHGPGWANSDGSFKDPREDYIAPLPPPGPLPKEWGRFKGVYRHGRQVVLSYTIGNVPVLESPALEGEAFIRSFHVGPSDRAMEVMICEGTDKQVTVHAPADAMLVKQDGQTRVRIAPRREAMAFRVALGGEAKPAKLLDLPAMTRGGPAMWTQAVETVGVLASEKDTKGPYAVDRITLPEKNPWNAWMRPGGMDFFTSDPTKAAICTWSGDVWIVSGIDDDLDKLSWKRFATGLHQPLGLKIVDDVIYTVGHDEITRLHDLNKDGEADFYECFNADWHLTTAFHAFAFDLHRDPQGNFVFAFGSPVRSGGGGFHRITKHHGTINKVSPDGTKLWTVATGLRAPNGIGVHPVTGQITAGDNEGTWVPKSPLHWVSEGEFLGVVDSAQRKMKSTGGKPDPGEEPKPLCWMPKNVDNSNGGQIWVTSEKWGPFNGELLHMSYGTSSLYKVLKEEVNGVVQGGVVKFPLAKLTSSAMRAQFNQRDGQLYVIGLSGWQSNAAKDGGFDRIRYTGRPVHMPTGIKVRKKGVALTFTNPLDAKSAADAGNYAVEAWNYKWTGGYGSGEYPIREGEKGPHTSLSVSSAKLLEDGRTVFLEIRDIQPVHQMKITINIQTADGSDVDCEVYHTIHVLGD